MKTYSCKITNRWMDSIESAGVGIASPKGGYVFIRKLDVDLVSDEQWELVRKCAFHTGTEIELSIEEMATLLAAVKASNGIYSLGKRAVKNVAAPQNIKVPQQKSYAQRNAERQRRIQNSNQSILGGCCPNCGSRSLKVRDHGSWVGYFCKPCGAGGSITRNKK